MTLIFSIFREHGKGELYILKKVGFSTFEEIYFENMYLIALSSFLTIFILLERIL